MSENINLREIFNTAVQNLKENNVNIAIENFEKILKLDPKHISTNLYLGIIYAQNKNFDKASGFFNKVIQIKPYVVEAHNNLGLIHLEKNEKEKARKYFEKAIQVNPNFVEAHNNLGFILMNSGDLETAEKCFKKSIEINPKYLPAYLNYGNLNKNLGKIENAEKIFQEAIKIDPKYFDAYNNLMVLYERLNQHEKLKNIINKADEQFKSNPVVMLFYGQYLYKTEKFSEAIKILENINFNTSQLNRERLRCFIIAKSYDQIENSEKAFDFFKKSNSISLNLKSENIDKNKTLDIIKKRFLFFNNDQIKSWPKNNSKNLNENPIFLIGFPRSGTTLLDTILRTHSSIQVIEEKPIVGKFVNELNKITHEDFTNLKNINDNDSKELRQVYFDIRAKYIDNQDSTKIYIDKMPLNIIHIAEIIRIFPEAKFLVSIRHPYDCVLSCFMQSFKLNDAMANFLNLNDTANLYNEVMRLWMQYKNISYLNYHYIKYEELVSNFEISVKKIFNFIEIDWSDEVFKFYNTATKRNLISTPSYDQVNKPIYSKAVGRWKKYESNFSEIAPILKPWIKNFNY